MSEVTVYDCRKHSAEWRSAIGDCADIYYTPEWLDMHLFDPGAQGLMFHFKEEGVSWFYPFVMREIPDCYGGGAFDIESAYGYAGPLSQTEDSKFLKAARKAFEAWCSTQNVIAEFCAFHPLLNNERWMGSDTTTIKDRETVSLNLEGLLAESAPYTADARYMLRRGEREGIEVVETNKDEDFDRFFEMYLSAMKSLDAGAFYTFNDAYFIKLKKLVRNNGWLLVAKLGEEWAAASLFIFGADFLHYHLSANNFAIKAPGATNMILHEAAIKGAKMGLRNFHLGGGRTPDEKDSLLKFKTSMGEQRHDFVLGKYIHNQEVYDSTVNAWEKVHPELSEIYANRLLKYRTS